MKKFNLLIFCTLTCYFCIWRSCCSCWSGSTCDKVFASWWLIDYFLNFFKFNFLFSIIFKYIYFFTFIVSSEASEVSVNVICCFVSNFNIIRASCKRVRFSSRCRTTECLSTINFVIYLNIALVTALNKFCKYKFLLKEKFFSRVTCQIPRH